MTIYLVVLVNEEPRMFYTERLEEAFKVVDDMYNTYNIDEFNTDMYVFAVDLRVKTTQLVAQWADWYRWVGEHTLGSIT